jgi:hypothetical protein
MPLLVDAYNVLHVTGVLPPERAGIDVDGLVRLIETSRYRDDEVVVVCDGSGVRGAHGRIEILYAGSGRTADEEIIARIDASTAPRRIIVVTSDQEIVRAARRRRCRPVESGLFLRQLAADAEQAEAAPPTGEYRPPPGTLTSGQVALWKEVFDVDESVLEEAAREVEEAPRPARRAAPPPDPGADDAETAAPEPVSGPQLPREVVEEARRIERELAGEPPDEPPDDP